MSIQGALRPAHQPKLRRGGDVAQRLANRATLLCLEAATLAGLCLATWWLSSTIISPHWAWAAMLEFAWLCILCFRIEPKGFALLLPIIVITRASVVVALTSIEYGVRLPELALVGEAGPYTSSYVCIAAILFASSLAGFRFLMNHLHVSRTSALTPVFDRFARPISLCVIALGGLAVLWLLGLGLVRGFPLLLNMDRFLFRRVFADPLTLNILNCKSIVACALGLVSFALPVSRILKTWSNAVFTIFVAVNFFYGDKFFIMISTASSFFSPYLYLQYKYILKRLPYLVAISLLVLLPVSGITWFIYSDQGRATVEATSQKLTERFAAQGELWYLQAKIGAPVVDWRDDIVAKNIEALSVKQVDLFALRNGIGPAYFMNRYAPSKFRAAQMRGGGLITYTMALEPLALVMFGWFGLVLTLIVSGFLFAAGACYLAYAIERRLMPSMIFAGYLIVMLKSYSAQGAPWVVVSIFTLKWLSVVLVIEMVLSFVGFFQSTTTPRFRLKSTPRRSC
ncbi:DUF6418 domain-containing protein [uncultured Novosphingobium sp.]|uniref:DUF6418 domain-containing protein n=1 Tax=uncultured Novosphingobium sp. TaxID=292277 RepID=UPI002584919A|nr:DUF6418 domain-containing protein [uncultured Novosphingobium sp.]